MARVYFDSTLFIAILAQEEPRATNVKSLLAELSRSRTAIYTSILSIAECSVSLMRVGGDATKALELIHDIAKVQSITEEIALATARLEAQLIQLCPPGERTAGKRRHRRWDCFHMATALDVKCAELYSFDQDYSSMSATCSLAIACPEPIAKNPTLF